LPGAMRAAKKPKAMKELTDFADWMAETNALIQKKQAQPLADYRKCTWHDTARKWRAMWREGLNPKEAAMLWALAHERRK
jgi:hypothetical protein